MTREEIEAMEAGPELDALIDRMVFNLSPLFTAKAYGDWYEQDGKRQRAMSTGATYETLEACQAECDVLNELDAVWTFRPEEEGRRFYSSEIENAWKVVEMLLSTGLSVNVSKPPRMGSWDVRGWSDDNRRRYIAHGDTAPLAICRAALLAVAEKEEADDAP